MPADQTTEAPVNVELTTRQVAAMTGEQPATIRQWVRRGHVERTRRGLISGASLLAYLDERGDHGQHTVRRATTTAGRIDQGQTTCHASADPVCPHPGPEAGW